MTIAVEMSEKRRLLLEKLLRKQGVEIAAPNHIPRRDGGGPALLSFGQQRLWFLQQLDPRSAAYNLSEGVRLAGPLDALALARALAEVVRRHEALRTVFITVQGQPAQEVMPPTAPFMPRIDLEALTAAARPGEAARLTADLAHTPFDLARGPLLTATLLRLGSEDHVLALVMHHIVSDGWSMGVLVRELTTLYGAFAAGAVPSLPTLPIQYRDFAAWQRGWLTEEILESQIGYWKDRLAGSPTLLELPTDRTRPPVQSFHGSREHLALDPAATAALRDLAREQGATLFMALVAAYAVLLQRATRQSDILIGSPVANRARPETEGLIGFFVNTVVLRIDLEGDPGFRTLLARVREAVLGADAHQDLPFERLVDALDLPRDLSRSPIFQVMLAFQNLPAPEGRPQGLGLSTFGFETRTAQFDLHLSLMESPGGLTGSIEYRTDLFDAVTVRRLARHFEALLRMLAKRPGDPVAALPLLTEEELQQVLVDWNDTAVLWVAGRPSLHRLIEAQVARTPRAHATVYEGEQLTYAELNARANRLARHLRRLGCGPETRVGVAMERSLDLVVALLGILKAGAAYVPLDPDYPAERLAYMLEDSRPAVLVTQQRLLASLPSWGGPVLCLDTASEILAAESPADLDGDLDDRHLAYMIYTSGSTGRPKGAMVHHRGIVNRLLWMQEAYRLTPAETVLQKTPFSFDVSVWEFFWPLLAGARLVLARPGGHRDAHYLAGLIETERVGVLHFVPSMLQVFLEEPEVVRCRSLRLVVASGEALPPDLERRFFQRLPETRLENLYGPTEASVDVTAWSCGPGDHRSVPIGRPIANTRIHLLDDHLQPVAVGVPGELWIGGVNVGRGYLGRPELTAERFVPDPFTDEPGVRIYRTGDLARYRPDGAIEYLGRIDHQVKIRGFRIELGEIEAVLGTHPAVREAAVNVHDHRGSRRLAAYLVPYQEHSLDLDALRAFLKERLPEYMVPAVFVPLEKLPLSPNGKLDRRALPTTEPDRPDLGDRYTPPRNPVEAELATLWAEVLGIERVGVHDDFFELGGDSIVSIQVTARARQRGLQLTSRQIFDQPTIAELALTAGMTPAVITEQGLVTGPAPLTPIQHWFFEHQTPSLHHFNQAVLLHLRERIDPAVLERVLRELLRHHDALRLRFHSGENGWRQHLADDSDPVPFACVDLSPLPEAARRGALEVAAEEVQASLDLSAGPIARMIFFDHGAEGGRLLFVVHHLAVDGVSWRILMEDLEAACRRIARGESAALPAKTTSFRQWAERLAEHAHTGALDSEAAFWTSPSRARVEPLALPRSGEGPDTLAAARTVAVSLPPEETVALLTAVPRVYNTQINDALLAALALAYRRETGVPSLLVDLEGHGREEIARDLDVSRTVGWFTSLFPVLLDLAGTQGPGEALKAVKEQLRALPGRGIGYGLLRYLTEGEAAERLRHMPSAEVVFNYLGQVDQTLPRESAFALAAESSGSPRADGPRSHAIEVNALVTGGSLHCEWTFGSRVYRGDAVERLARGFITALSELVAHCQSPEAGGYTPSDFPAAELSQGQLESVLAEIGADFEIEED
jgi:amino acid adenylation domain-containing protein/non-ribosomal peptide synthase protein (TIGR01720 family)